MDQFNQQDLDLIILEIERQSQKNEKTMNRQQIIDILHELNLPEDRLDEVLVTIEQKKQLTKRRKKRLLVFLGVAILFMASFSYWGIRQHTYQQALAKMMAIDSRITLEEDDKNNLTVISRQNSPRLHFRVTFENTPVGRPLKLGCDWINPQGQIVHQNRYQTRQVEKEIWHSRCRYRIGDTSLPGNWEVKMFSGQRLLISQEFQVK